jgi:hypothetical protein
MVAPAAVCGANIFTGLRAKQAAEQVLFEFAESLPSRQVENGRVFLFPASCSCVKNKFPFLFLPQERRTHFYGIYVSGAGSLSA